MLGSSGQSPVWRSFLHNVHVSEKQPGQDPILRETWSFGMNLEQNGWKQYVRSGQVYSSVLSRNSSTSSCERSGKARSTGISCLQQRGGNSSSSRHAPTNSCLMQPLQYECECAHATFTVSRSAKFSIQIAHLVLRLRTMAVDGALAAAATAGILLRRVTVVDGPPAFFCSCQHTNFIL